MEAIRDVAMQRIVIDQFRSHLRQLDTSKYAKSAQRSLELRKNGNNCFCKGKYEESLKYYNQSLSTSPSGSKELLFSLANRATALFHLARYNECLSDIEKAFAYGYPLESAEKLIQKQLMCKKKLQELSPSTSGPSTQPATASSEQKTDQNIEREEDEIRPAIRFYVHPKILVSDRNDKGCGLIADENIPIGNSILIDQAVVCSLSPDNFLDHCYHCLCPLPYQPYPCRGCNQIVFCDKKCSDIAWEQYHSHECKYLDYFQFSEHFHYSPRMAVKILLKYGINTCLSYHRNFVTNFGKNSDKSIENTASIERQNAFLFNTDPEKIEYSEIYSLVEHPEDGNDYRLFTLKIVAFLMEIVGHSFVDKDLFDIQTILVKHFRQTQVNAIAIQNRSVGPSSMDPSLPEVSEKEIGCGLFLKFRFINHSCKPNCWITHFDGHTLAMQSLVPIESGQEITHAYGVHYRYQVKSLRQKLLQDSYFFSCTCEACSANMQPLNKAFLCPECEGPVVCDATIVCLDCGKKDHIDVEKILFEADPCIKLVQIDEKDIGTDDIRLRLLEKTLQESYIVLSGILYKTHQEMAKLIRKLLFCWIKLEKRDKMVPLSLKLLENVEACFEPIDTNVLNALLVVLYCHQNQLCYEEDSSEYLTICNRIKSLCSQLFPKSSEEAKKIISRFEI
ncbi:protein-lysine N-methyltransferase SMYD4-like [Brevipalpus obovatus]|uniref:protein-lysine N-methyltransferase SMYD4-like n=1 Tax=Brevipalpus obovatus TaxID=246614 RepID=UPI003D9F2888